MVIKNIFYIEKKNEMQDRERVKLCKLTELKIELLFLFVHLWFVFPFGFFFDTFL